MLFRSPFAHLLWLGGRFARDSRRSAAHSRPVGTRILAVLFAIDMLVAIFVVKMRVMKVGFSAQQATGWEFDFALLAISLALLFTGAGTSPRPIDRVVNYGG